MSYLVYHGMNTRRTLKIAAVLTGIVLLLFVVLVVHVGQVSVVKKNDKRVRQLSRIDFKEPINAEQADGIKSYVASLEGVSGVHFSAEGANLTYMYDPSKQTSASVYEQLMLHQPCKAEKFVVNPADLTKGCPAFAEKGGFSKAVLYCATLLYN